MALTLQIERTAQTTPHRRATCTAHTHARRAHNQPRTPTISTGPCPLTVAGPYAVWMPRKSLHGRTCGVSRDGGRARTPQQIGRIDAAAASNAPLRATSVNSRYCTSSPSTFCHPRGNNAPRLARAPT
ncbi:hypothetical protein XarbCFBP8147_10290 [Xanthomonas arboricola]|nr:hypothetical protein XarbCFBP8147_10290 [Xanthomonas arboricola]